MGCRTTSHIRRDGQGAVTTLHRPAEGFDRLDQAFIRVPEDLIHVLMRKQMFNVTDLPADVDGTDRAACSRLLDRMC